MKLKHFYHIFADGHWQQPFTEHIQALNESGLMEALDFIGVGIIGSDLNRKAVREALPPNFVVVVEAQRGWEQITLESIDLSEPAKIFYAHTKGASNPDSLRILWRQSMTNGCVYGWKICVDVLDKGYSAVGCYWRDSPQQHFSGTFWWTTTEYLKTLPMPILRHTRFDAEMWIGKGPRGSRMADLCPGPVHRLNVMRKPDFEAASTPDEKGYVTFYSTSKIAGFARHVTHTARLTPFIQSCIDKGHFQVVGRDNGKVKTFLLR